MEYIIAKVKSNGMLNVVYYLAGTAHNSVTFSSIEDILDQVGSQRQVFAIFEDDDKPRKEPIAFLRDGILYYREKYLYKAREQDETLDEPSCEDEGWQPWFFAGALPPVSEDARVEVLLNDGRRQVDLAKEFRWNRLDKGGDVVAWRCANE